MDMSAHPVASAVVDPTTARIAAYNPDGAFERDLRRIWDRTSAEIIAAVRAQVSDPTTAETRAAIMLARGESNHERAVMREFETMFTSPIDADWIERIAELGDVVSKANVPLPQAVVMMVVMLDRIAVAVAERLEDDHAFRRFAMDRLRRLIAIRCEIVVSRVNDILRDEAARQLLSHGAVFRDTVSGFLASAKAESHGLRERMGEASGSTRGMLGKASEVAAAAEQSAVAMREAAQTAAGLIRAIEEARNEVEVAAGVATRARDESDKAVEVSRALSEHAQAIESILGLIRDIAGQTNLLALNATIEAARAGDAGRGFAVVAQEVKSLASQTARATDDIAAKIGAIQVATRQTVDVNSTIRATVSDVQTSAQRIRQAMETQAHTVTMITAAVDETALAADAMSSTIAAIRSDTESLARDIDQLDHGFRSVDGRLTNLDTSATEFVANLT